MPHTDAPNSPVNAVTSVNEPQTATLKFSDPGLNPKQVELTNGFKQLDAELEAATKTGYTRVCIRVEGHDYWLKRQVGCNTWLPVNLSLLLSMPPES